MFKILAFLSPLNSNVKKRTCFSSPHISTSTQKREHTFPASRRGNIPTHTSSPSLGPFTVAPRREPAGTNLRGRNLIPIGPLLNGCWIYYLLPLLLHGPVSPSCPLMEITPWAQLSLKGRLSNTCALCPAFWSARWGWGSQPFSPAQRVGWVD